MSDSEETSKNIISLGKEMDDVEEVSDAEDEEEEENDDEEDEYDTRSEASGSIASRSTSSPSRVSSPTKSSSASGKKIITSPRPSQRMSSQPHRTANDYDYQTKLNYLFRGARFFMMKSHNSENIELSKVKGVWSTLPINESKLNDAVRSCRNVILVFSVKESGKFAGFARLNGPSRKDVPVPNWVLPPGLSMKWLGGVFSVDWICQQELSFTATTHLYNLWNEGKPIKIGRDGQELEPRVAQNLLRMFPLDSNIDMTIMLKRSKASGQELMLANSGNRGPMKPMIKRMDRTPQPMMLESGRTAASSRRAAMWRTPEYANYPYPSPYSMYYLSSRYYEHPHDPLSTSLLYEYEKRAYERHVDEFLMRTSERSRRRYRR